MGNDGVINRVSAGHAANDALQHPAQAQQNFQFLHDGERLQHLYRRAHHQRLQRHKPSPFFQNSLVVSLFLAQLAAKDLRLPIHSALKNSVSVGKRLSRISSMRCCSSPWPIKTVPDDGPRVPQKKFERISETVSHRLAIHHPEQPYQNPAGFIRTEQPA